MAKTCTKCTISKDESEFAKNGKFGLHTACKQCARDAAKKWREENKEMAKERDRLKHIKNRDKRLAKMRDYDLLNKEKKLLYEKNRYTEKREQIKAATKNYRLNNRHMVYAWNNARRCAERRATPSWADFKSIAAVYKSCFAIASESGIPHHVDHIIPLRGKLVCGLHVHNNLQVIPASDNLRKGIRCECD